MENGCVVFIFFSYNSKVMLINFLNPLLPCILKNYDMKIYVNDEVIKENQPHWSQIFWVGLTLHIEVSIIFFQSDFFYDFI